MGDPLDLLFVPGKLTQAGRAATVIADGVRAADVAGPVRAIGAALPGSGTATAAQDLATRWQAGLASVADGFRAQGDALTASAEAYTLTDQQIDEAFGALRAEERSPLSVPDQSPLAPPTRPPG